MRSILDLCFGTFRTMIFDSEHRDMLMPEFLNLISKVRLWAKVCLTRAGFGDALSIFHHEQEEFNYG